MKIQKGKLLDKEDIPIKKRLRKKQNNKMIKQLKYDTRIFPGIRFDNKSQPVKIIRPLELHELKLIVALRCDIELRSPRTARAYKRSNKDISFIKKKLDESSYQRTVIRNKNNYPYNLKPNLQHWIAWSKGYTWQELEQQLKDKQLPFILNTNVKFYWINDPKFRSILTIPHYHLIYEK